MSITFSIPSTKSETKTESCLCAQMSPNWVAFMHGEVSEEDADLAKYANPDCPFCHGRGVESVSHPEDGTLVNMCNTNALSILTIIGLPVDYCGKISVNELPKAIRGCIYAMNSNKIRERVVRQTVRVSYPTHTEIVMDDDGLARITQCGGGGYFSGGFEDEAIKDRVSSLLHLFRLAQQRSVEVCWG